MATVTLTGTARTSTSVTSKRRLSRFSLLMPSTDAICSDELPSPSYKRLSMPGSTSRLGFVPRRRRLIYALIGALFFVWTWGSVLFGDSDDNAQSYYVATSMRGNATKTVYAPATDLEHLRRWIAFGGSHAIDSFDRLSFAQMGFQARMYAYILQDDEVPGALVRQFEQQLWSFVPGLPQLRAAHGHREANTEEKVTQQQSSSLASVLHRNTAQPRLSAPTPAVATSRGIVVVTGNEHFLYTIQLLSSVRDGHRCDIPIEVYYCGADDLSTDKREFIESTYTNVRVVDLLDLDLYDESFTELVGSGWALRPYALMASNFTEAILVDADTVLLTDPHDLFNEKGYKQTGTLFFHDRYLPKRHNDEASKFLQMQLGRTGPSAQLSKKPFFQSNLSHLQDSGVVLMNKANPQVFSALLFTLWQNAGFVRDELTYVLFHGDKESYWLSHELAGFPYHFSPFYAGAVGPAESARNERFCSDHLLHLINAESTTHHEDGDVEKKRRSGKAAWMNGSMLRDKVSGDLDDFLDMTSSIWSTDGIWESASKQHNSTFCLRKYTIRASDRLDVHPSSLVQLLEAAKRGTEAAFSRFDEL